MIELNVTAKGRKNSIVAGFRDEAHAIGYIRAHGSKRIVTEIADKPVPAEFTALLAILNPEA